MRTSLVVTVSALAVCVSVGGAADPALDKGPLARMELMREKLALSEAQWEKLQPLLKQEGDKVREILADSTLSTEQKRAKAKEVTASGREQIKELLTPEQRQKLAAEMKVRQGAPGGEGTKRLAELKEKLGLSEEQVAKLRPVLAEEGPKLRALREDKRMTPEEKRTAFEASFERISSELTVPQRDKLREEMRTRQK
jgi:hypothetical protein